MKRIRPKIFYNLPLKHKILTAFSALIMGTIVLTGAMIYNQSALVIKEQANRNIHEILQQSTKYMNEKLEGIMVQLHFLQTTEAFKNIMLEVERDTTPYSAQYLRIQPLLAQIAIRDEFIKGIHVYTPTRTFQDTLYNKREAYLPYSDIRKQVLESGLVYWGSKADRNAHQEIIIAMRMNLGLECRIEDESYVVVVLDDVYIRNYLQQMHDKAKGDIYILNKHQQMVFSYPNDQLLEESILKEVYSQSAPFTIHHNYEKLFINQASIQLNQWQLISVQEERVILRGLMGVKEITLGIIFMAIFLASIISIILAKSISEPLDSLKKIMAQSPEQNFSVRVASDYDDEVNQLGKVFNMMSDRIQRLIYELKLEQEHIKDEQVLKRKAELKALHEQINPHFLYNALDSIYWRSLLGGNKEVGDMAVALSDVFRIGLNKGKEMTTIRKEFQHVESYLSLQQVIYDNGFDYTIHMDAHMEDIPIIKIILQPLVENSIIHGFKEMDEPGKVWVSGTKTDQSICLSVCDNGCGFHTDKLLEAIENDTMDYKGYALSNVIGRLRLHYEESCDIDISSIPYEKTCIRITIGLTCKDNRRDMDV